MIIHALREITLDHVRTRQMSLCILCTERQQPRFILGTADYYIILISQYGNFMLFIFFMYFGIYLIWGSPQKIHGM